jgi:hypothetical protein
MITLLSDNEQPLSIAVSQKGLHDNGSQFMKMTVNNDVSQL